MKIHSSAIRPDRRRWIALIVICLGQLMIVLDSTIVNVALPSIQRDLHFSQANLTWVVNGYLIAYGSFLLIGGRAGDLIGRRKVFLAGVLVFTMASVLSGLAQDSATLIGARFLQGLGGALSAGVILALIVTGFPQPSERAQAMSVFTFVLAGGGSLGLLAGGMLTQMISWHWIFFINVPIGVGTLLLGWRLIEENEGIGLSHGVDVAGSILVSAAVMLGVYAIVTAADQGWGSDHTIGFGAAAILLLIAFFWLEARLENPILPPRILRLRSLTGASAARAMLATGMFTTFFLGALYLQNVKGYGAVGTGLAFLPTTLALAVLSLGITARLMRTFGPRALLIPGLVLITSALVLLSTADQHAAYFPGIFGAYLLFGIGAGMSFMPLMTIMMADVPAADAGVASGVANVTMQVGAAFGLAALGTIATDHSRTLIAQGNSIVSALTGGYQLGFAIAAACVATGLLIVVVVLRSAGGMRSQRPIARPEPESEEASEAA
ncbi:MAG: MFS transporter [Actinobacteria bacterium 13_1_40CM_2_65_8]|nr:MAG: MFS transporter [Chloroflexi bacterium 13_1_40CM_65_17]OLD49141.1 MAG: MFS transporter [Actinobacteria bacterium 13_1_40CM_2_65_8]